MLVANSSLAKDKTVIEISDEDYGDIPDEDLIRAAEFAAQKPRSVQSRLEFPKTAPKPAGALRVGRPQAGVSKQDEARKAFLDKRKADLAAKAAKTAALLAKDKPAAPKVVESSSEDENSSDDDGNNLFKLGSKLKSVAKQEKAAAPRKRKVPVVRKRVRDNRARIAPDLSPLYKQIFKWDFFHNDAFPPGLSASQYSAVQKSFKGFGAYKSTFEPLLLLEAWQSFLKCKEEATVGRALEVKIATRMRADAFVELETTIDNMDDKNRWFESDVVLLSTNKNPLSPENAQHCLARVHTVTRKFNGPREVQLRCEPGPLMLQKMTHGGKLHGVKIMRFVAHPVPCAYTLLTQECAV
jgi:senataxin